MSRSYNFVKLFMGSAIILIATAGRSQVKRATAQLTLEAHYIFRNVRTTLSVEDRNFFAQGYKLTVEDGDTILRFNGDDPDLNNTTVSPEIFPLDLNKDGIEEIFVREQSDFFGPQIQDLSLYIRNKKGQYVLQENVTAPEFYARATSANGYPDLIGGAGGGPGFAKPKTSFDVFRWSGEKYILFKKGQPHTATDISIEDRISPMYQATLPAQPTSNNAIKTASATSVTDNTDAVPTSSSHSTLSPAAAIIFDSVATSMSDDEKNQLTQLINLSTLQLTAKTKSGKRKFVVTIYPVDFNQDHTEEIFAFVTAEALGLSIHSYYFFAKNYYGKYAPAPGKLGAEIRIIVNDKTGFPDLLSKSLGLNAQVWSWNGMNYALQPKPNLLGTYKTLDVKAVSESYVNDFIAKHKIIEFPKIDVFDGNWYSPDFHYSFKISGRIGIATLSNSGNYRVGDTMLVIKSYEKGLYHGMQKYTDGAWHGVILKKVADNKIWMQGGATWYMYRKK